MYTVYIIYSKRIDRFYIGFSSDVEDRLLTWLKNMSNPVIEEYCDKTPDEIKIIEQQGTFDNNLFGYWWHQTTTCELK